MYATEEVNLLNYDEQCMLCLGQSYYELAKKQKLPEKITPFMREALRYVADGPVDVAAPQLVPGLSSIFEAYFDTSDPYAMDKERANHSMMAALPWIRPVVETAEDPLQMAMKVSQLGNYLDYAVLTEDVIQEQMQAGLSAVTQRELDAAEYEHFVQELKCAHSLLIIGDNAGEIALDTLVVRQIRQNFPQVEIFYGVRGTNAQNDATRQDAAFVGMDQLCTVIDSGSNIPGTVIPALSQDFRKRLESADVILSKGQGNIETLMGCGLNIYYLFQCKCQKLSEALNISRLTGVFTNERRLTK